MVQKKKTESNGLLRCLLVSYIGLFGSRHQSALVGSPLVSRLFKFHRGLFPALVPEVRNRPAGSIPCPRCHYITVVHFCVPPSPQEVCISVQVPTLGYHSIYTSIVFLISLSLSLSLCQILCPIHYRTY